MDDIIYKLKSVMIATNYTGAMYLRDDRQRQIAMIIDADTCRDRESADIINIRLTHWEQLR